MTPKGKQIFNSDLISSTSRDVRKVVPGTTIENLLCCCQPNQKTPPEPSVPPRSTRDDLHGMEVTCCARSALNVQYLPESSGFSVISVGPIFFPFSWQKIEKGLLGEPPVLVRTAPACCSVEDVASANGVEHQDGERDKNHSVLPRFKK